MNTNIWTLFWPIVFSSVYGSIFAFEGIVADDLVHWGEAPANRTTHWSSLFWRVFGKIAFLYTNFYSASPARFDEVQKKDFLILDHGECSATLTAFCNGRSISSWQISYGRYTLHTIGKTNMQKSSTKSTLLVIGPCFYGCCRIFQWVRTISSGKVLL